MAKWEIIEDNKFKKGKGGKAAASRTVPAKRTAVKAAATPNNLTIITPEQKEKAQADYDESYKWTSDYMNSPMYKKMLTESSANTREFDNIDKTRWSNFKSIPPLQILPQPRNEPNTGGTSLGFNGQVQLFPYGFGTKAIYSHELSHSTDRPVEESDSRIIPQSDKNYISQHVPTTFEDSPMYATNKSFYDLFKKNKPKEYKKEAKDYKKFHINYVGQDTETRARLNAIRQGAQQNNLYDPFKEGVTPELYYDKLKNFKFEKEDKSGADPMYQLKNVYSDEEIIYMLNHISENKKENDGTELNNLPKAKNGGKVSGWQIIDDVPKAEKGLAVGERKILQRPTSTYKEPSTVLIKDNRKINPVTNSPIKPTRDLKSGNYSAPVIDAIISQAVNNNVDPYKALAIGLQESGLEGNIGHVLDYTENSFGTDPEKLNQMTQEQKLAFIMVNAMKNKEEYAKKLGYSDDAHYLQAYNGFGNLTPRTEKKYHNSLGVGTNSFYGIDVTKNPINTAKNPVYGKTVLSLANMLKTNPTITERVGAYNTFNNLLDKSPVGLIKQPFKNGGVIKNPKYATGNKVSGWEIIDDVPKFKRGGKTNLNSTVEEEPKNTVKVNQNGQIIEYDPSSPEYKKLYESGTLTSYDPETDAYITPTLKEFTVVEEKPKWAKEKENNQSKYSKDWYIDNYLPKFSRNMGISADNMNPNDVERYNSFINDKTVEDIFKRYPLFDSDYANDRLGTLKQFSPKEIELIKNSSYANKIQPSIGQDFEEGLFSLNSGPVQFKNENLTQEEAKEKSNPLSLLAPLSIPYNMTIGNLYTQQQGEKNYSWLKALKGQKPIHNSTALSIAADPLNLLGLGLFGKLVSAGKIAKLEDAYQLVKGLGKEEALSKLKSLISLDNIGKNSFTPVLDNVGVEALGVSKPTAENIGNKLKSQITNLKEQEILAEESRKALWADYKAGKITGEEYTTGTKQLNQNELLESRSVLEKQLKDYNIKQEIVNTPQQNILKSENQLGKNIAKAGISNKGVFELGDNYVARLSAHGYDDASLLVNYADKIKSPRIAKTLQVKEINGKVYQVQEKVIGTPVERLTETELQNIPKEHIDNFLKDKAELEKLGLYIDFDNVNSNMLYDPKKGFQFIDLGISPAGNNMMASNEIFAQTYKGLKLPSISSSVGKPKLNFSTAPASSFKSEINWGNWNKEIPENKALMQEYNAIEQSTKANGSWMKNPDGSPFKGSELTKEEIIANPKLADDITNKEIAEMQFVQQYSKNFKNAFGDDSEILYHATPQRFKKFDLSKFNINSASKSKKVPAIYLTNNKLVAQDFLFGKPGYTMELYNTGNTKKIKDIPNFTRSNLDLQSIKDAEYDRFVVENTLDVNQKAALKRVLDGIDNKKYISNIYGVFNPNTIKSAIGNNGMFDIWTNPGIYKSILPYIGYTGAGALTYKGLQGLGAKPILQQQKNGGIIEDPMGQWAHPGSVTRIPSNQITMQGVNYPVLGVSDRGHTQMMYPGKDYSFRGKSVTEYPMMQGGGRYISESVQPQPSKNYTGTFLPINRDPYGNARKKLFDNENRNPSTESVMGINDDSGYYNIPTVVNGVRFSDDDAVNNFYDNGMYHTGYFNTQEEADRSADYRERANIGLSSTGLYKYGGEINFTYAGENHRVYEKESPTGNGKGIEGHIMVNHPTKNKGKWDTIDLTKITNGRVKTVAQGVASTKKWHKENPEYADGGMIKRADGSYSKRGLWDNIRDNAGSGKKPTKEMLKQERKIKSQYATGGQVSNWEIIEDLPKMQLAGKAENEKKALGQIQKKINEGYEAHTQYQKDVLAYAEKVKDSPDFKKLVGDYVTQKCGQEGGLACISTATKLLEGAGYPLGKGYHQNPTFQADVASGRLPGYTFTNDMSSLEPADLVLLTGESDTIPGNERVGHHMMPVMSVNKNGDNTTQFKWFGSQGNTESIGYHESPTYSNSTPLEYEILKKQFVDPALITTRDSLKNEIKKIDPTFDQPSKFKPRYTDYNKDQSFTYNPANYNANNPLDVSHRYITREAYKPLINNKEELMKKYNIDNSEFNQLVKILEGIGEQETKNGLSPRYGIKQIPGTQTLAKLYKGDIKGALDPGQYSEGPWQTKGDYVPKTDYERGSIDEAFATLVDRYKTQVPNKYKKTDYGYGIAVNKYKGMDSEKNDYVKNVLNYSKDLQVDGEKNVGYDDYLISKEKENPVKNPFQLGNYKPELQTYAPAQDNTKANTPIINKSTVAPKMAVQKPGQSVALPPQFQKGGKTNIPIYVNDPKDPRLQMYSDSLSNYNKNEIFFKDYQPLTPAIAEQIKTSYQSGLVYKKRNNPNLPGYDVVYKNIVKKPTQPYILKLQDHAQEQINMPTMGNINSSQQIAQQISQPIINIPTVIPPKKDYVTIKTGSSYRNPETGAFQQKSFKIDKGTGKKVSEETFKNGGKTKKSSWQIIEY